MPPHLASWEVPKGKSLSVFVCLHHFSAQSGSRDIRKTRVVHVPLDWCEVPRHQEIKVNDVKKSFAKEDDKEDFIPDILSDFGN